MSFSAKLTSIWVDLACGYSSQMQDYLHLEFHTSHVSSQSKPLWVAALPSDIPTAPLGFASSAKLMGVHFVLLPKSLDKTLNKFGCIIDPCGTPQRDDFQPGFMPLITTCWALLFSYFSSHLPLCSCNPYPINFFMRILQQCPKPHQTIPLVSPHLPGQLFHLRGLSDWLSMTHPWQIHADCSHCQRFMFTTFFHARL